LEKIIIKSSDNVRELSIQDLKSELINEEKMMNEKIK